MVRVPFGYHDADVIRADVDAAAYSGVIVKTKEYSSKASSAMWVALGFRQGTPMRAEIETRSPEGLNMATRFVADWLINKYGDGAIAGKIQADVVEAAS